MTLQFGIWPDDLLSQLADLVPRLRDRGVDEGTVRVMVIEAAASFHGIEDVDADALLAAVHELLGTPVPEPGEGEDYLRRLLLQRLVDHAAAIVRQPAALLRAVR